MCSPSPDCQGMPNEEFCCRKVSRDLSCLPTTYAGGLSEIGLLWSAVDFSSLLWSAVNISGLLWSAVDFSNLLWSAVNVSGLLWSAVDFSGLLCSAVDVSVMF